MPESLKIKIKRREGRTICKKVDVLYLNLLSTFIFFERLHAHVDC